MGEWLCTWISWFSVLDKSRIFVLLKHFHDTQNVNDKKHFSLSVLSSRSVKVCYDLCICSLRKLAQQSRLSCGRAQKATDYEMLSVLYTCTAWTEGTWQRKKT
jgi:hypothetical protein